MNDIRCAPGHKHSDSLTLVRPASFKRLLDGAPCSEARTRRAPFEGRPRPRDVKELRGQILEGGARRGVRIAWLGVVGRSIPIFPREPRPRRPATAPYDVEVTKEGMWAGARRLTDRA